MPTLRARLRADLPDAMRDGDASRVAVLRTALAALDNAEAVDPTGLRVTETERRHLTEDDQRDLVEAARTELRAAAREMTGLGQPDRAAELERRAEVLDSYLS
jgi:uncharacterized protein